MQTRSKEITDTYFRFLDKHIADVVSGEASDFGDNQNCQRVVCIAQTPHRHRPKGNGESSLLFLRP